MTIPCCDNSGGRLALTIDGVTYSARSSVTIRPTNVEKEAKANYDGTIYTTTKAVPAEADITIGDKCGLDLETLTRACHVDATIQLIDMNRTYLFSKCSIVGRPEINSEDGEIKGLKIASMMTKVITN